jgi:hypothetical protein
VVWFWFVVSSFFMDQSFGELWCGWWSVVR